MGRDVGEEVPQVILLDPRGGVTETMVCDFKTGSWDPVETSRPHKFKGQKGLSLLRVFLHGPFRKPQEHQDDGTTDKDPEEPTTLTPSSSRTRGSPLSPYRREGRNTVSGPVTGPRLEATPLPRLPPTVAPFHPSAPSVRPCPTHGARPSETVRARGTPPRPTRYLTELDNSRTDEIEAYTRGRTVGAVDGWVFVWHPRRESLDSFPSRLTGLLGPTPTTLEDGPDSSDRLRVSTPTSVNLPTFRSRSSPSGLVTSRTRPRTVNRAAGTSDGPECRTLKETDHGPGPETRGGGRTGLEGREGRTLLSRTERDLRPPPRHSRKTDGTLPAEGPTPVHNVTESEGLPGRRNTSPSFGTQGSPYGCRTRLTPPRTLDTFWGLRTSGNGRGVGDTGESKGGWNPDTIDHPFPSVPR